MSGELLLVGSIPCETAEDTFRTFGPRNSAQVISRFFPKHRSHEAQPSNVGQPGRKKMVDSGSSD